MSFIERIKQSLKWTHLRSVRIEEVESGSVRVLLKIVHRVSLSFLYLCHVMPFIIRQQHGRSRSSDVALMCLILCSVAATHCRNFSWLSPVFVNVYKHWINDNDRLINTDNNGIKVWFIQRIRQSIDQSISCWFPVSWRTSSSFFFT
jgi:hypothetical protein